MARNSIGLNDAPHLLGTRRRDNVIEYLRALFSFEFLVAMFLNSGASKVWLEPIVSFNLTILTSALCSLGVLIYGILFEIRFTRRLTIAVLLFLLVLLYVALTAFWSPSEAYRTSKLVLLFTVVPLSLVSGVIIGSSYTRVKRFLRAILLLTIIITVTIALRGFTLHQMVEAFTGYGTYQAYSHLLASGIIAALLLVMVERGVLARGVAVLAIAVLGYMMLFSGGRGAILVVLVSSVVFLALVLKMGENWKRLSIIGGLALAGVFVVSFSDVLAVYVQSTDAPLTIKRIVANLSIYPSGARSDIYRASVLKGAWDIWLVSPVFGVGLGGYPVVVGIGDVRGYPHNVFMELLSETGMVGLFLYLAAGLYFIRMGLVQALKQGTVLGFTPLIFFCGAFSVSLVSGDIPSNKWAYVGLGMLLAGQIYLGQRGGASKIHDNGPVLSAHGMAMSYFPLDKQTPEYCARGLESGPQPTTVDRGGSDL